MRPTGQPAPPVSSNQVRLEIDQESQPRMTSIKVIDGGQETIFAILGDYVRQVSAVRTSSFSVNSNMIDDIGKLHGCRAPRTRLG